jgi:hypothetical protein
MQPACQGSSTTLSAPATAAACSKQRQACGYRWWWHRWPGHCSQAASSRAARHAAGGFGSGAPAKPYHAMHCTCKPADNAWMDLLSQCGTVLWPMCVQVGGRCQSESVAVEGGGSVRFDTGPSLALFPDVYRQVSACKKGSECASSMLQASMCTGNCNRQL